MSLKTNVMATKKVNPMFSTEGNTKEDGKKPTLRQFLKGVKNAGISDSYRVEVIWLPGTYDNYQLQTTHFRASVSNGSKLYQALRDGLDEFTKGKQGLFVVFDDERRGVYTLSPDSSPGEWFWINDIGLRWDGDEDSGPEF